MFFSHFCLILQCNKNIIWHTLSHFLHTHTQVHTCTLIYTCTHTLALLTCGWVSSVAHLLRICRQQRFLIGFAETKIKGNWRRHVCTVKCAYRWGVALQSVRRRGGRGGRRRERGSEAAVAGEDWTLFAVCSAGINMSHLTCRQRLPATSPLPPLSFTVPLPPPTALHVSISLTRMLFLQFFSPWLPNEHYLITRNCCCCWLSLFVVSVAEVVLRLTHTHTHAQSYDKCA